MYVCERGRLVASRERRSPLSLSLAHKHQIQLLRRSQPGIAACGGVKQMLLPHLRNAPFHDAKLWLLGASQCVAFSHEKGMQRSIASGVKCESFWWVAYRIRPLNLKTQFSRAWNYDVLRAAEKEKMHFYKVCKFSSQLHSVR